MHISLGLNRSERKLEEIKNVHQLSDTHRLLLHKFVSLKATRRVHELVNEAGLESKLENAALHNELDSMQVLWLPSETLEELITEAEKDGELLFLYTNSEFCQGMVNMSKATFGVLQAVKRAAAGYPSRQGYLPTPKELAVCKKLQGSLMVRKMGIPDAWVAPIELYLANMEGLLEWSKPSHLVSFSRRIGLNTEWSEPSEGELAERVNTFIGDARVVASQLQEVLSELQGELLHHNISLLVDMLRHLAEGANGILHMESEYLRLPNHFDEEIKIELIKARLALSRKHTHVELA